MVWRDLKVLCVFIYLFWTVVYWRYVAGCTWFAYSLWSNSLSSTKSATPKRTTRRSGQASVATTPCSESCPKRRPHSQLRLAAGEARCEGVGGVCLLVGLIDVHFQRAAIGAKTERERKRFQMGEKKKKKKKKKKDQTQLGWKTGARGEGKKKKERE